MSKKQNLRLLSPLHGAASATAASVVVLCKYTKYEGEYDEKCDAQYSSRDDGPPNVQKRVLHALQQTSLRDIFDSIPQNMWQMVLQNQDRR